MKLLDADSIQSLLDSLASPREQARAALIVEIREAHAESLANGDVPEGTPAAATFTLAELTERGVRGDDTNGAGLKAGRNGKGEIALVRTLAEDTVLIVLRDETDTDDDDTETE